MFKKINALSLFNGIGIEEIYLREIGINVAVLNTGYTENLYKEFNPKTITIKGNIKDNKIKKEIISKSKYLNVEIIVGSIKHIERTNIYEIIDIINEINPTFIFLTIHKYYVNLEQIISELTRCLGKFYNIEFKKIKYNEYGIDLNGELNILKIYKKGYKWDDIEIIDLYKDEENIITLPSLKPILESININIKANILQCIEESNIKNYISEFVLKSKDKRKIKSEICKFIKCKIYYSRKHKFINKEENDSNLNVLETKLEILKEDIYSIIRQSGILENSEINYYKSQHFIMSDKVMIDIILRELEIDKEIIEDVKYLNEIENYKSLYSKTKNPTLGEQLKLLMVYKNKEINEKLNILFEKNNRCLRQISSRYYICPTNSLVIRTIMINKILKGIDFEYKKDISSPFFEDPKENSIIKTEIVIKYFNTWLQRNKNKNNNTIQYIDLYCGPGIYKDGTKSTPIKIIESCIKDKNISQRIKLLFNDVSTDNIESLKRNIDKIKNLDELKYKPILKNEEITNNLGEYLENKEISTSFMFLDPFGYKGISKKLLSSVTKNYNNECILFFSYDRINRDITNSKVEKIINELFGSECINIIRQKINDITIENGYSQKEISAERETIIIDEFCDVIAKEEKFVLPFRFEKPNQKKTSHYLIFITKNYVSFKIMKDIMNKISSDNKDGVGSFSYIPNKDKKYKDGIVHNYALDTLEELEELIWQLEEKNKELIVNDICKKYVIKTRFIEKNIKDVLKNMENKGKLRVIPKANRRKNTMGDKNRIVFLTKNKM